jgi:murein DD-endopeptidase MepM/ murein hydrolase activator NlpD
MGVRRSAVLLAASLLAGNLLATPASAQTTTQRVPFPPLAGRLTHTCVNPNPGFVFLQQDGGYQETAQGWFYNAEVHQGSGWALAYCYYGLDMAAPSNRPVYSVHYEMMGYKSNQCTVSGPTVTCTRIAVLKQ